MRNDDVVKCWPFSDEVKKEQAEALLPPITVTKFKWWSHELNLLRSNQNIEESLVVRVVNQSSGMVRNESDVVIEDKSAEAEKSAALDEKSEMVCPVCRVFVAATVNAVNAHIDDCLAQASKEERRQMRKSMKAKSKAPKKRSITEIFAVAPQIDTIEDVSDGNEGSEVSEKEDELADDFKVLNVSTSSNTCSIIKSKKKKTKLRKKDKKKQVSEASNTTAGVIKFNKKKTKTKKKKNGGSIAKKVCSF